MEALKKMLDLLYDNDVFALLMLGVVLSYVGKRMIQGNALLRAWGWRLAAVAFVTFFVIGVTLSPSFKAQALLRITFRGLIVACVMLGAAWIALACVHGVWQQGINLVWSRCHACMMCVLNTLQRRARARRMAKEGRQQQDAYAQAAPQREQMRREAEARTKEATAAQQRRTAARLRCENFYSLHGPELHNRFSRAQFVDYLQRHLADDQTYETVEQRAIELLDLMQQHLTIIGVPPRKRSLADLAAWLVDEKRNISALPLSDDDKEQILADLERRFTQLQQMHLRKLGP